MKKVLIVFYSEKGSTQKMAIEISNGVNSISGVEAVIRTVPVKEGEENNIANEISMNFSLNESDTKKNIIEKTIKTAFVKID